MTATDTDRLAELAARRALGQYTARVTRRLDELFTMPHGDLAKASRDLLNAADHLGVTGADLEAVAARLDTEAAP